MKATYSLAKRGCNKVEPFVIHFDHPANVDCILILDNLDVIDTHLVNE
jgi:hypothetical protein